MPPEPGYNLTNFHKAIDFIRLSRTKQKKNKKKKKMRTPDCQLGRRRTNHSKLITHEINTR